MKKQLDRDKKNVSDKISFVKDKESGILDLSVAERPKKSNAKKKAKHFIIVAIIVMLAIGAVSVYALYINPNMLTSKKASENEKQDVGMYGSKKSYIYYPIDYNLDITTVEEYMDKDRAIHYTANAETIIIDDTNVADLGKDAEFFVNYFKTAISGDYSTYNSLFTESYYKNNEPYYSFTSQMIYDIEIEKLSEKQTNDTTVYGYNVSYKIYKNNGTFRNDIGSDGSKTLYFELLETNNEILINRITYYIS